MFKLFLKIKDLVFFSIHRYGRIYCLQVDRVAMLLHLYRFYRDAVVQQVSVAWISFFLFYFLFLIFLLQSFDFYELNFQAIGGRLAGLVQNNLHAFSAQNRFIFYIYSFENEI